MAKNVSQKWIGSHLIEGRMEAGQEIGLKIDQTLTQDAYIAEHALTGGQVEMILCGSLLNLMRKRPA